MRRLPLAVVLAAVLGLAVGCGGEEPVVDDGTQGVPLAGLGPQLESADVEVVGAETPAAATDDEVVVALERSQVLGPEAARPADVADDVVAFDPTATAGLLSLVSDDVGGAVVLVFTDPSAAAVFAAGDPEVFTDAAVEEARAAYLAGNVVGYASSADDHPARVRRALDALDGPGGPATP